MSPNSAYGSSRSESEILEALGPELARIGTFDALRPVVFYPETWRRALPGADAAAVIDQFAGGTVTRDDLRDLSADADPRRGSSLVRLFVATQIWGSGTTNGRGPRYTRSALSDPRLLEALSNTYELSRNGKLAAAHSTFRVSGVGPAFFTKWFWSSTLEVTIDPAPLILDARVWASLRQLGWSSLAEAQSRLWCDRYVGYLRAMQRWSAALGTSPEELEWVLFDWHGDN